MNGWRSMVGVAALVLGLTAIHGVESSPGFDAILRNQSQAIGRAINKNIDLAMIHPRLRVNPQVATGPVTALALSQDEKSLVTAAGDKSLRVWDLGVGREVARLRGHAAPIRSLALSPDSKLALSGDASGNYRLWDLTRFGPSQTLALPATIGGGTAVFVPGTRNLSIVATDSQGQLQILDLAKSKRLTSFPAHRGAIPHLLPLPGQSNQVIAGGDDGRIVRWDLTTKRPRIEYQGHRGTVRSLAVDDDGNLLIAGDASGQATLWAVNQPTPRQQWAVADGPVTQLAISGAGGVVATEDKKTHDIRLWSLDGTQGLNLAGHEGPIRYLHFDREGKLLLSASEDGTTRLWQVATGQPLITLIATTEGWAVVDALGRFDGNAAGLTGVEWAAQEQDLPLDNFTGQYYQPGLLPTSLAAPATLGSVHDIRQGIHRAPLVNFISALPTLTEAGNLAVPVRAEAQGSTLQELALYQNGKRVGTTRGGGNQLEQKFNATLVSGENVFKAVATSAEGVESSPAVAVVKTGGATGAPVLHLLAVGVNRYRNPPGPLTYAVPDATALRAQLERAAQGLFREVQVTLLTDEAVTRDGILQALQRLRQVSPLDIAVIYLAGHGVTLDDDWYFVPQEYAGELLKVIIRQGGGRQKFQTATLSANQLRAELENIAPQRVLVLIDSCQSGGATETVQQHLAGMKSLRFLARTAGLHILAATDRAQLALEDEKELGHGVFTYTLLQALMGQADTHPRNQRVSVSEALSFVEEQVPQICRRLATSGKLPHEQYPVAHSRGVDFDLGRVSP